MTLGVLDIASVGSHDLEAHVLAGHTLSGVVELLPISSHIQDGFLATGQVGNG